jgi:hypothetical protein
VLLGVISDELRAIQSKVFFLGFFLSNFKGKRFLRLFESALTDCLTSELILAAYQGIFLTKGLP